MAQIIKPKRGTTTPTSGDITTGEMAIDTAAQKLYINDSGTVKEIGGFSGSVDNLTLTTGNVRRDVNNSVLNLWGGNNAGANIEMYGSSHATQANNTFYDANLHTFRTAGGSNLVKITNTGDVLLATGNGTGRGITFNSGSFDATKTLDYYEEGTWTPVLADAATGGNTATFGYSVGKYTRVGNVVTMTCLMNNINTSGMTAGNTVYLRNLPFTSINSAAQNFFVGDWDQITNGVPAARTDRLTFVLDFNKTYGPFVAVNANGTRGNLLVSNLASGAADIKITCTYLAT